MKSVADGISEDSAAKLQEKAEPGLVVKQKGRWNKSWAALERLSAVRSALNPCSFLKVRKDKGKEFLHKGKEGEKRTSFQWPMLALSQGKCS